MRLCQTHVHLHYEVLSVALEECMSLLIEDDDDVARFQSWFLVALAGEGHFLPVLHSLVHGHLRDLPLAIHLAPVALLTPELGINPLPLSMALPAHRLDLLHHPRPKLLDSHLHASSSAVRTLLDGTRLASNSLASVADDVLLEGKLPHRAVVHVFQGHRQLVHQVLCPARPSLPPETPATKGVTTTTSEEHVKDVHGVHSSAPSRTSFLDPLLTRLVVQLPLLGIRQNLIGH